MASSASIDAITPTIGPRMPGRVAGGHACPAGDTPPSGSAGRGFRRAGSSSFGLRRRCTRRRPRGCQLGTATSFIRKRVSKLSVPSTITSTPSHSRSMLAGSTSATIGLDLDLGIDRAEFLRRRRRPWAVARRRPARRRAPAAGDCWSRRSRGRRSAPGRRPPAPACWPATLPNAPQPQTNAPTPPERSVRPRPTADSASAGRSGSSRESLGVALFALFRTRQRTRAPRAPHPLVIDLAVALRAATGLHGLHVFAARTKPHTIPLLRVTNREKCSQGRRTAAESPSIERLQCKQDPPIRRRTPKLPHWGRLCLRPTPSLRKTTQHGKGGPSRPIHNATVGLCPVHLDRNSCPEQTTMVCKEPRETATNKDDTGDLT